MCCIESMHALLVPHIFQQLRRCLAGWLAFIHRQPALGGERQRGSCCGNRKSRGQPHTHAHTRVGRTSGCLLHLHLCSTGGRAARTPGYRVCCSQQAAASWGARQMQFSKPDPVGAQLVGARLLSVPQARGSPLEALAWVVCSRVSGFRGKEPHASTLSLAWLDPHHQGWLLSRKACTHTLCLSCVFCVAVHHHQTHQACVLLPGWHQWLSSTRRGL